MPSSPHPRRPDWAGRGRCRAAFPWDGWAVTAVAVGRLKYSPLLLPSLAFTSQRGKGRDALEVIVTTAVGGRRLTGSARHPSSLPPPLPLPTPPLPWAGWRGGHAARSLVLGLIIALACCPRIEVRLVSGSLRHQRETAGPLHFAPGGIRQGGAGAERGSWGVPSPLPSPPCVGPSSMMLLAKGCFSRLRPPFADPNPVPAGVKFSPRRA